MLNFNLQSRPGRAEMTASSEECGLSQQMGMFAEIYKKITNCFNREHPRLSYFTLMIVGELRPEPIPRRQAVSPLFPSCCSAWSVGVGETAYG